MINSTNSTVTVMGDQTPDENRSQSDKSDGPSYSFPSHSVATAPGSLDEGDNSTSLAATVSNGKPQQCLLDLSDSKTVESLKAEGVEIVPDDSVNPGEKEGGSRIEIDLELIQQNAIGRSPSSTELEQNSRKRKLSTPCKLCGCEGPKYTCPRCEVKTCSLRCVKEHKAATGCTGERDKLAFVDMAQYSEIHLLNDYRFLEDAERKIFKNKAGPLNRRKNCMGQTHQPSKKSKLLAKAAAERDVLVRFVSPALSKNKNNSSFFTISTDTIDWHIEWRFVASSTVLSDTRVPETSSLMAAALKFTNPVEFPHLRKVLEVYRAEDMGKCRYLMKMEGLPANVARYFELNPRLSIRENLKGLFVVEFPTVLVLPKDFKDSSQYQLLSQSDMLDMDKAFSRHIMLHHPDLNPSRDVEQAILDPKSSLYAPTVGAAKRSADRTNHV